jgi:DNA-binding beta-propeller fold protein YncE
MSTSVSVQTDAYEVVNGWPALPSDLTLGQVTGVGIASGNRVFIFHRAGNSGVMGPTPDEAIPTATVHSFDGDSGAVLSAWGENLFVQPHGLRVDSEGQIWLTDIALHQVFCYSEDGEHVRTLGEARVPANDKTHFNGPCDVAFAADGSVYVADGYGNSRVAKFSPDGEFILEWGSHGDGPGEMDTVHGITVDNEGRVYVASRGTKAIQVFDENGKFLDLWRSEEIGRPWGLTVGPDNLLYVVDGGEYIGPPSRPPLGRNKVLKMDLSGQILATWSRFGNYNGQLYWGHDVAIGDDGAVYVGDVAAGMRVQKFVAKS